nr:TatD family hydrolase [Bacteroidota bacterium]
MTPFINIHTHQPAQCDSVLNIRNVFASDLDDMVFKDSSPVSVGLHPWHINASDYRTALQNVSDASELKQVLAIGETGLDKVVDVDTELQKVVFIRQMEIAAHVSKPVIVHCVRYHNEVIACYKQIKKPLMLIFHGFNNNIQTAEQLLKYDFYLSFGEALLRPSSNASKVFALVPDKRIFLETDESDKDIADIYSRASQLRNISVDKLKKIIFNNFKGLFSLVPK